MPIEMIHLNTGFTRSYPQGNLAVLDHVLPVIDAGQGEIPGIPGFFVRIHRSLDLRRIDPPPDGVAWFTIAAEPGETDAPWIVAYACWKPNWSALAWSRATMLYETIRPHVNPDARPAPPAPPRVPWLAQMFTQQIRHLDPPLTPANVNGFMLASTWALMEGTL